MIVKPVANALFLSNIGIEQLPAAFILVAISAALFSSIYIFYLKKTPLIGIIYKTLYSSIFSLILFWIFITFRILEYEIIYLFYIWVTIFGVLAASQFWILANIVLNSREAKRLIGFIGSGAIAGGIFGGYLTSLLVNFTESQNLILVATLFIAVCLPIAETLWRKEVFRKRNEFLRYKKKSVFTEHPVKLIRQSKHLLYLSGIIGISVIAAKLVDYQFNAIASGEIKSEGGLTAFFGFWFSNLNIISLVIQLFITRRVVGTFGVGTSLFILPAGLFIGTLSILFFPFLWAAVLVKVADGSLKQSVNRSGIELLSLPIPPEIKNQTKSFIDIFVDSLASGIGGIILVVFSVWLDIPTRYISLITIFLLGGWIYLAYRVRLEYLNSFKEKFGIKPESKQAKTFDLRDDSALGVILNTLETGTDDQKIQILKLMEEYPDPRFIMPLCSQIVIASDGVKTEALKNLYNYRDIDLSEKLRNLIPADDEFLQFEILKYIFSRSGENLFTEFRKYHDGSHPLLKAQANLCLADEIRENHSNEFIDSEFEQIFTDDLNELQKNGEFDRLMNIYLEAIGTARIKKHYPKIMEYMSAESACRNSAVLAAGLSLEEKFIPNLVRLYSDERIRGYAVVALKNFGEPLVQKIFGFYSLTKNEKMKKNIPHIIGIFPSQRSANYLIKFLEDEDQQIVDDSLKIISRLKRNNQSIKFDKKIISSIIFRESKKYSQILEILYQQIKQNEAASVKDGQENEIFESRKRLVSLLERRLDLSLGRIFKLLGLKYPPADMDYVLKGIRSDKKDIRGNAVEFLENILDPKLRRLIIPLIEASSMETIRFDDVIHLHRNETEQKESLKKLLASEDTKLRIAVLDLMIKMKDSYFENIISEFKNHPDEKISSFLKSPD